MTKEPSSQGTTETSNAGISIFQKLVSVARSDDKTMAALSQWILDHQSEATGLTISDLAQRTNVSDTTVFRFCKILGLKGYKDLRFALAEGRGLALGAQMAGVAGAEESEDPQGFRSILRRVIEDNTEQLLKTMTVTSPAALKEATELVLAADHIHMVGFGSSAPVAVDACRRLLSLGLTASAHSDPHILAVTSANARPGTLFFGISCSGRTRDVIECFETVREKGLKCVVITSDIDAPVTQHADIVLVSAVRRSPVSIDILGTRVSQLAIIEAICVALSENYPQEQGIMHDPTPLEKEIAKKRLPDTQPSGTSDHDE